MTEWEVINSIRDSISKLSTVAYICGGTIVTIGAVKYGHKKYCDYQESNKLRKLTLRKQAERYTKFTKLRAQYKLTPEVNKIAELPVGELIEKLQDKSITATQAHLAKALESTEKCNNVTEFVPQAMEWAAQLDSMSELKGPLHGLPFAIKDDTDIQGMDSTLGYAHNLYKPASEHSVVVKVLLDLGAIPFCKTNVPQTMFSYGSDNPIFGETTHSRSKMHGPGGSSAGSGSLVGFGGAPIATGSDIGGSVCIPAAFNGLVGIKPTLNRLSGKGQVQCIENCVGFVGTIGLLCKDAKVISLVLKELVDKNRQNSYDPLSIPIPWNEQLFTSKEPLRIGYYTSLPFFPALGDVAEVTLKAKEALESLGHTLIPFEMPDSYNYMKVIFDLLSADLGQYYKEKLKYEKIAYAVQGLSDNSNRSIRCKEWLAFKSKIPYLFPSSYSPKRLPLVIRGGIDIQKSSDLWKCMGERANIRNEILNKMSKDNLDLILCPAFPFPALRVRDSALLIVAIVYTMIWNLIDFPASVLPFGVESTKNIQSYNDEGDVLLKLAKEGIESSKGMPISLQFVGRPFKEELVMRMTVELQEKYKQM